jgi:hypothetical protein
MFSTKKLDVMLSKKTFKERKMNGEFTGKFAENQKAHLMATLF